MKIYYHLRSTVKRERFFVHVYFSNETSLPYNCDDWTIENVSFGARNCKCLFHSFSSNVVESATFHNVSRDKKERSKWSREQVEN